MTLRRAELEKQRLISVLKEEEQSEKNESERVARRFNVRLRIIVRLIEAAKAGEEELKIKFEHQLNTKDKEELVWFKEFCEEHELAFKQEDAEETHERSAGDEYDGPHTVKYTVLKIFIG